ncbi:hypothetical protein [Sinorhizobium meliloti]|jgi:hypothetical protein|uniref:hypothetical protein n=1 Tax=Rhizobium meliloti TaxID=382 RepID=UPI0020C134CD|nr:hypothetical protein [Sinorhizobium meliloti]
MKTPQRSFVVEFKSARRQPKAPKNSIWGDTDLKALAREVEEKASHLFSSTEAPATSCSPGIGPAGPIISDPVSEDAGDVDIVRAVMPSADGAEIEMPGQQEADRPAAEAVAQVQKRQSESQPGTSSSETPRKRVKISPTRTIQRSSKVGHEDPGAQTRTVKDPISLDELAALDADNKRLKRLLAEQVHAQNLLLKNMLARFGVE